MANVLVLYKTPADAAAFDKYYSEKHIPLAKKIPGLRSYRVSKGEVTGASGAPGVHLVAVLAFDSMAAIHSALASPEGKAAAQDIANFATGGADLYMYDDAPV